MFTSSDDTELPAPPATSPPVSETPAPLMRTSSEEIELPAPPTPSATSPPASETPAPLTATSSDECEGDSVVAYEQCGGTAWTGSTCCEDGLECVAMGKDACYSEVRSQASVFGILLHNS